MTERPTPHQKKPRHGLVAASVLGVVVVMGGLSFAAVPLYQMFCRVTGFGGTPQVASKATTLRGERSLSVRFDSNVEIGRAHV